jgi:hypothetical protein
MLLCIEDLISIVKREIRARDKKYIFKKTVFFVQNGARGIHTAAMKGHVAVIQTMLSKGENVDAVTNVSGASYN